MNLLFLDCFGGDQTIHLFTSGGGEEAQKQSKRSYIRPNRKKKRVN